MSNFVSVTKYGLFNENGMPTTTLCGEDIFHIHKIRPIFDTLRLQYKISQLDIKASDNPGVVLQPGNPSDKNGGNLWIRFFDNEKESKWIYLENIARGDAEPVFNFVVLNCLTQITDRESVREALKIEKRFLGRVLASVCQLVR